MPTDTTRAGDSVAVAVERDPRPPVRVSGPTIIIGAGVVGSALGTAMQERGTEVCYHDPALELVANLSECGVAFVCVPTPYDEADGVDLSAVRSALDQLPAGTVAVLRSTVLPGTTEVLQDDYPHLALLHAPEFLTESRAIDDERRPARKIIGYTKRSKPYAGQVDRLLPDAPFVAYVVAREAELVKYFANCFYALKVSYANQVYDLCEQLGVYYGMVRECALADPMMAPEHLTISHNGYRGFGGKCLPKDTRALAALGRAAGAPLTLLDAALTYNATLNDQ